MDFARRILQNYGWKDGDGLGKNKSGIKKPLRATLKFDNAGFGADQATSDFNNHWWERVFNEAATNVNITKEGENIKMELKDRGNGVEISTKGYSVQKLKKLKEYQKESTGSESGYDNFLQAATLTNLGVEVKNSDKIDVNDIEVSKVKVLTDEELFKACGGRTAHKGARHGLKLNGKLSRIEKQEAELLAEIMAKHDSFSKAKQSTNKIETKNTRRENNEQCTAKRKKKDKAAEEMYNICDMLYVESSKLKKKKCKPCKIESVATFTIRNEIAGIKSKRSKPSNKKTEIVENNELEFLNQGISGKNNHKTNPAKRKKKNRTIPDIDVELLHK